MPSLDASSYFLIAALALAVLVVLRRRGVAEPEPARLRPLAFRRLVPQADKIDNSERPLELLRWEVEMQDTVTALKAELDSKRSALEALVHTAKRESDRLEAAIHKAESLDIALPTDSLAVLERLADPTSLADPQSLAKTVAALPVPPSEAFVDLFQGEQIDLNIANLAAKGFSASEIAHRLQMPLGEAELRLSMVAR